VWQKIVGEVEQRRSTTWATVFIEARFVPILRDHFGRHCQVDGELADGRVGSASPHPHHWTSPAASPAGL
jgi:hypothetical protein